MSFPSEKKNVSVNIVLELFGLTREKGSDKDLVVTVCFMNEIR